MAQKDPLAEYRAEGHAMFNELRHTIREEVVLTLFHAQIEVNQPEQLEPQAAGNGGLQYQHETAAGADVIAASAGGQGAAATAVATPVQQQQQAQATNGHKDIGRNDPCWCGSGKKFKRCHGA
jgi:preprotein translocase subunit SecA